MLTGDPSEPRRFSVGRGPLSGAFLRAALHSGLWIQFMLERGKRRVFELVRELLPARIAA